MKTRTRIWFGVTAAIALTPLVGCSAATGSVAPGTNEARPEIVQTFTVSLDDGRDVLCVFAKGGRGGGLSCDWSNAR